MKEYLKAHNQWHKKARQEFKQSRNYKRHYGENFHVREDGSVTILGKYTFFNAVTAWLDSEEFKNLSEKNFLISNSHTDLLEISQLTKKLQEDFDNAFLKINSNRVCELHESILNDMYLKFIKLKKIIDYYTNNLEIEQKLKKVN